MKRYNFFNNIIGWLVFVVSSTVFLSTMEPSVSLWDCGEFITAANKLEVGHPPGAPLFLLISRIFTLLSPDKAHVAVMMNSLSALASGFAILFLFWTITQLSGRIILKEAADYTPMNIFIVLLSGTIGAMSFCFTDSFWFSAVESEVYGMSVFLTALTFWAILKWENKSQNTKKHKWLVLVAFLLGLSIGVHLLNLLVIPPVILIIYFSKYKFSLLNCILALVASISVLLGVMYLVIPGNVFLASGMELFCVNGLGLPFNSGVIIYIIFLLAILIWALYYSYKKKSILWNTVTLCITVMLLGFSSYAMIVIRANANPPVNTNKPDNILSLLYYLNREQYGDNPLLYGPYYNAPHLGTREKKAIYRRKNGHYVMDSHTLEYIYDSRFMTFFPRMYSSNPNHVDVYKSWGTIKGTPVPVTDKNGEKQIIMKPSFGDNLEFFIKYQIGYLYLRYFMWNFSGKQNDLQGNNGIMHGNWISGIRFIDNLMLGPQEELNSFLKNNKGHNCYYLLPLILGVLGSIYQFSRNRRFFAAVLFLFLMTGFAIAIYTNQTPVQPRERDYAYTGSYFAFSIWIGFGVLFLFTKLKKYISNTPAMIISGGFSLSVPTLLLTQNWDDHDRNGRFLAHDLAYNYLVSCAPNAILFTAGDNDTFPLWYLQEVEGVRTDVRVVNLMLLNTDWYIDQMKLRQNESEGLPVNLTNEQYSSGRRDFVYVLSQENNPIPIKKAYALISSEDSSSKIKLTGNNYAECLPTREIILPVDKKNALESGALLPADIDMAEDSIVFSIPGNYIGKSEIIVLDILSHFGWKRPIYFTTPGYKGTLGLEHYFQLEGFAYRLVPIYSEGLDYLNYGRVEPSVLYDQLMKKFQWNIHGNNKVLMDDHMLRTISIIKIRNCYARLALALAANGKFKSGIEVLDRCMQVLPVQNVPYDSDCIRLADAYYKCGAIDKGNKLIEGYRQQLVLEMNYYKALGEVMKKWTENERNAALGNYKRLQEVVSNNGQLIKLEPLQ